jgi:hypothetical protein
MYYQQLCYTPEIPNGRQIFINGSVALKLQPGLQYCKYDVIWRPSNEEKNHDFFSPEIQ